MNPPRTISAASPRKTRPRVLAGRHHGPRRAVVETAAGSSAGNPRHRRTLTRTASREVSGPDAPDIDRPVGGTPCCTRRKRDSAGASSSQISGRLVVLLCRVTPERGREIRQPSL